MREINPPAEGPQMIRAYRAKLYRLIFSLSLLEETRAGERLRPAAPWVCGLTNALAAMAMLLLLQGGMEVIPSHARRAAYIAQHVALWRIGWAIWMVAGLSLVSFYCWW